MELGRQQAEQLIETAMESPLSVYVKYKQEQKRREGFIERLKQAAEDELYRNYPGKSNYIAGAVVTKVVSGGSGYNWDEDEGYRVLKELMEQHKATVLALTEPTILYTHHGEEYLAHPLVNIGGRESLMVTIKPYSQTNT